jgi:gluconolactonase
MTYYAPPQVIKTEPYAKLPEKFRKTGKRSTWYSRHPNIECFLEGPSFDRKGNLYFVDIPFGRIFRLTPEREFELVTEYDGEPGGLKIHKDGRIFITDYKHGLIVVDPDTGKWRNFTEVNISENFKGLNDLVFTGNGDLYFTDQGKTDLRDPSGRLYRLSVSGRVECLLDNMASPNGLVFNPAETTLYVGVTRSNQVWSMPIGKDGNVGKVGLFAQLPGMGGPDGMAMDVEGNLSVVQVGSGVVWLLNRKGLPLYRMDCCCGDAVSNVAYGGKENKTLFILGTVSGEIITAQLPTAGQPMFSHQ